MKSHRSAGRHNFLNLKLLLKHLSNHSYTAVLHDIYMYLLCHFLSYRFLRFPRTKRVFIILHLGVSKIQAGFSIWFMKKGVHISNPKTSPWPLNRNHLNLHILFYRNWCCAPAILLFYHIFTHQGYCCLEEFTYFS